MKYAILYKQERSAHDYYHPETPLREYVDKFVEMSDEVAILDWIKKNDDRYSSIKNYRILRYEELSVSKTVNFNLKSSD